MSSKQKAALFKDQGNQAFKNQNFAAAVDFYTKAIEHDRDNHVLYSNRSAAYFSLQQFDKAAQDGSTCIAKNESFSKGYFRLGAALEAMQRYEEAIDAFRRGLKYDPSSDELQKRITECTQAKRESEQKRSQTNRGSTSSNAGSSSRSSSNNSNSRASASTSNSRNTAQSSSSSGGSSGNRSKSSTSSAPSAGLTAALRYKEVGVEHYNASRYQQAIEAFTLAWDSAGRVMTEETASFINNRAMCWQQLGHHVEIVNDCTLVLDAFPDNVKALLRRGLALEALEKYRHALEDMRLALSLAPSNKVAVAAKSRLEATVRQLERMEDGKSR